MARINLRKFIAEHYKAGVSARDVIREALTNSIHAGASQVSVYLHFSEKQTEIGGGTADGERRVLERITISDDGEGFTSENLNFFDEICTGHKDSIGGKGVGRLAFLKYANKVEIRSQLENELVEFVYTPEFKLDDVEKTNTSGPRRTEITLHDLKGRINTQVTKLVNSICDDLRLLLFLKHQSGQTIKLDFSHNSRQPFDEYFVFSGADIKSEIDRSFEINGISFKCYAFRDDAPRKGIVALLCADEICIEEFVISKRFDVCRHSIFVTSDYFNRNSDIERQNLKIPKTDDQVDMMSPISREKLMPRIHQECLAMINISAEGDIEQFRNDNINKLRKYYPFIRIESLGGSAALLDADEVVRTYRAQLARKEDQIVEAIEDGRVASWDDVSHLASDDLARFIVHRALVIDSLERMPSSSAEAVIHDAILPRKSDGSDMRDNNIWLIDDKFLSYSSIFSDESLARIVEEVGNSVQIKQKRRPDVAAFFSKDSESRPNKLVIIEFKKASADIFENTKALQQCRLYAGELCDKIPSVREVFAFSVVEIDDEFYRDMKQTGYKDVFSLNDRVLYNDFQIGESSDIPLHLYVMPASALIKEAKARNRVFEEVLRFNF